MKLAIYDMDGTIVCSLHRYRTMPCNTRIDLDFWIENAVPDKISQDSLLPHSEQYFKDLDCIDTMVIIATARTMEKEDANFKYILDNLGNPDIIVHRKEGDKRSGTELKTTKIMKSLTDLANFDTITIYEDNKDYLQGMTDYFEDLDKKVIPVFVKSNQGH